MFHTINLKVSNKSFEDYKEYLIKNKSVIKEIINLGDKTIGASDPYHKNILISISGKFIVGIVDLDTLEDGIELLKLLISNISKLY